MSIIDGGYQIVYVNSRNRINGTDSAFQMNINLDRNKVYDRICLLDISIPKSYYTIQSPYNTMTLDENGSQVLITIPEGNYNRNSFRLVLQTQLNDNSPNSWVYAITNMNINTTGDNGKYTFTVSGNSGVQPSFIFAEGLFEHCGFQSSSTNPFVANTLQSVNVVNFSPESTLFLRSDCCSNNTGDNILQNIITTGDSDFSYITWSNQNIEMYSKVFNGSRSSTAYFALTNEDNQIINLNGLNIVFTILIYKKRENIDQLMKLSLLQKALK